MDVDIQARVCRHRGHATNAQITVYVRQFQSREFSIKYVDERMRELQLFNCVFKHIRVARRSLVNV